MSDQNWVRLNRSLMRRYRCGLGNVDQSKCSRHGMARWACPFPWRKWTYGSVLFYLNQRKWYHLNTMTMAVCGRHHKGTSA
jgi:hypothetical protein